MKRRKKKLLYGLFVIIMIISAVVFYIEYTKEPEVDELFQPKASDIEVDESEYEDASVNNFRFKLAPDVDLAEERRKHNNNDIVGRLEIPDLFNVLVVKGSDNKYYLNRSVDKTYDVRGTEFLDYRLTPTSKQVNIYGHNSRDPNIKVAFIKLEKLLDKKFFDEHPYIIFQYDGGKALYEIKAIKEINDTNNEHMKVNFTGQQFIDHFNALTNMPVQSRDISITADSEIIVLQTCSHHWDNALYIITAVKLDYKF